MLKAADRMHSRQKIVQIGCTCMGQRLTASYRTLKDEESGLSFCMMMFWGNHGNVSFDVQKTDEYMHLYFEDNVLLDYTEARNRENDLAKHGSIELPDEVLDDPVYKRVYDQLLRSMTKQLDEVGYILHPDLTVETKA